MLVGLGTTLYNNQILQAIPAYCPSCPPNLVLSLVSTESGGNQFDNSGNPLTSSAGAIGLFQLMPATAKGLSVNPNDPSQNIQGGLTLLQQLYNQYGDWTLALEAYNEGPGNLAANLRAGITPVSAGYAQTILQNAGIPPSGTTGAPSGVPGDLLDTSGMAGDSTAPGSGLSTEAWLAIAAAAAVLAYAVS